MRLRVLQVKFQYKGYSTSFFFAGGLICPQVHRAQGGPDQGNSTKATQCFFQVAEVDDRQQTMTVEMAVIQEQNFFDTSLTGNRSEVKMGKIYERRYDSFWEVAVPL